LPVAAALASWHASGLQLWPAWRRLEHWEDCAIECIGMDLGAHLLVLWAIYTFGHGCDPLLAELVDEDAQPRFGDEILEDVARLAFSLGASWGASLTHPAV